MSNNLTNELSFNFINYAAACNSDRAIPDATSGLKPVARRILYGAYEGGRVSTKPHVKCARIVGEVMGNLHPHGDSSIYGALVRLAQPWIMRYPLIDFHGNMGNVGGDGPAASRYTEARLSKISEEGLLYGLKKHNVPFVPNYDESSEEPTTLPAIFPNLLCNPNTGIGVALACNWLPHNLNEVAQAIYDYMDGKEPMVSGPDFPGGGVIINKNDMPKCLSTGHGSVKIRGRYNIEGRNIIFYEIPYGTSTESLMNEIGELADKKEIEGITDVRDESTLKGLRIVIQCDKNANQGNVIRQLFNKTHLQNSVSYNQVALVNKTPTELNLKNCIQIYLQHNESCLIKEVEYDKVKAEARKEIVEGLLKALEDIDNIIKLIKESKSSAEARENLINGKYHFTENQAKAIVNMKLGSLAGLERLEVEKEEKDLIETLQSLNNILSSKDRRYEIIKERLANLVKKYGDERRTGLTQVDVKPDEKAVEFVKPEDVVVVLTTEGNIKRTPLKQFKVQKRNGKGSKHSGGITLEAISTNTVDMLVFFTNKGKMYKTIVDNVPEASNTQQGVHISTLLKLELNEKVIAMTSLYRKSKAEYVVFFTKQGILKKSLLSEFTGGRQNLSGIKAITLQEGDSLANVSFFQDEDVIILTKHGMSIHFSTKDILPISRIGRGIKAIKLADEDEVVCGLPIHNKNDLVAVFSNSGMGKKMSLDNFTLQKRGGKGITIYPYSTTRDIVVGAEMVDENDNVLLVGSPNSICITAKDVPLLSRSSRGNIMMKSPIYNTVKL